MARGSSANGAARSTTHERLRASAAPCRSPRAPCVRQESAGPRAAALIVQQPARRQRRQQEIVVDHAVVVDRRGDSSASFAHVAQHREFADVLLVRHLAIRREAIEHRGDRALHRLRFEHRREQQCRDQRVASEVRVEAPGAGEKLVPVSSGTRARREHACRRRRAARQQRRQRHERRLSGERLDPQTQRRARRGDESLARTRACRLAVRW